MLPGDVFVLAHPQFVADETALAPAGVPALVVFPWSPHGCPQAAALFGDAFVPDSLITDANGFDMTSRRLEVTCQ